MRILFFGTYDIQHHPRVQVLREGLAARGHEVPECNVPLRVGTETRVRILRQPVLAPLFVARVLACWARLVPRARQVADPDIVLVGYLGQFDVLLAHRLWPRAIIVLDHLAPAAEVAADRGLASRWRYVLLNVLDRWALSAADVVLIDTEEHRALLPPDARDRGVVVPVGALDVWFGTPPADSDGGLRVVFFGTYTPLQGTPVIGEAIALLAGRADVRVTMIGRGQDYAAVRRLVGGNRQVRWLEWLEPRTLARVVAEHDVCLGIFGVTEKAARVVPTKVYQGAAAGCAIVTSNTAPQERMLGPSCLAVPPGDARALADALAMLADRPDLVATARQQAAAQAAHYRSAQVVLPLHRRLLSLSESPPRRRGRHSGRRPTAHITAIVGLLVAVTFVLALAFPGRIDRDPAMLGPQENVRFQLAQEWVHQGRPVRDLPVFSRLPPDVAPALTPRDAALEGHRVMPKDFPYALGLVTLLVLLDPRLALATSIVSALALLAAIAALGRRLGGSPWSGVMAAAVMATTGAFTAGSAGPLNTGAALALAMVVAVLLLCPSPGRPAPAMRGPVGVSPRRDVLAGVAFGIAIGLHHDAVLLAAGFTVSFTLPSLGGAARARRISTGAALALLPVLGYYAWLFGSPFTTGYAVGGRFFDANFPGHSADVLALRPELLEEHVRRYLLRPEILLLLLAALLACRYTSSARRLTTHRIAYGLLLGGLPYLAFVGSRPLYGGDHFTAQASFLRYAIPVVALLVCLGGAALWAGPPVSRRTCAVAVSVAALIGVLLLGYAAGGPLDQRQQALHNEQLRAQVLGAVQPGALVVSARGDKLLWPKRSTITAAYLVRNPAEGVRSGPGVYDVVPTPRRLSDVVSRLVGAGERVYVLDDGWLPDRLGLDLALNRAGVRREPTTAPSMFRITALTPAAGPPPHS